MEASVAPTATGSTTVADLIPRAAIAHGANVAARYKREGAWQDVSYAELAVIVQEIGLGLIDLGIEPGERVCILANTRPEWSYADMAVTSAGAVVVPIYQTNSPEECQWVISDSGASAIICEDSEQLAKVAEIREQVPGLRTIIVIDPPVDDPPMDAITLERVARAWARARRSGARGSSRGDQARGPLHIHLHLRYHRPTKGMCAIPRQLPLDHGHAQRGRADRGRRGHLSVPPIRPRLRPVDPTGQL